MSGGRRRAPDTGSDNETGPGPDAPAGDTGTAVAPQGRRAGRRAAQEAAKEARKADSVRRLLRYRWPALAAVLVLLAVVVFLVVRSDGSSSSSSSGEGRSQSTLLVQLVPEVGRATVGNALTAADSESGNGVFMALPGPLITDVPGRGSTTLDQTTVVANGPGAGEALADQLGVLVDGSWVLTEPALASLVDKVGGISVDVDVDVIAPSGRANVVVVPKGSSRTLDGAKAVAYATYLGPNETEADRMARFTDTWRALLAKMPGEVDAMRNLVAGSAGSVSTFPPEKLATYLVTLHDAVGSDSVSYPTLPTVVVDNGAADVTFRVDGPKVPAVVKREFAGSLPPVRPGGPVSALVQNGVGTPGLAEKARTKLRAAGITFQSGGNAARFGYPKTLVLIPDATDKSQANGTAVAQALGLPATAVRQAAQGQSVADVLVILGADFRG